MTTHDISNMDAHNFAKVSHVIRCQGQVAKDLQLQPASDFEYSKVPNWTRHSWAFRVSGWCHGGPCRKVIKWNTVFDIRGVW